MKQSPLSSAEMQNGQQINGGVLRPLSVGGCYGAKVDVQSKMLFS